MKKLAYLTLIVTTSLFLSCSNDENAPVEPTPTVSDPTNFSQTIVTSSNFPNRRWHRSVVFNNKIWVIGGEDGSSTNSQVYNSTDGTSWAAVTTSGTFSASPTGGKLLVFNNKIWLLDGFSSGPSSSSNIYNSTDGVNWVQVSNSGTKYSARHFFDAIVFDNKMWVIGGLSNSSTSGLSDIWSSTDGVNWSQSTPSGTFFNGRFHHKLAVLGSKMYLIGGADNGGSNTYGDVWSTTNGINWTKDTNDASFFAARYSHEVVTHNNTMYVIGGQSSSILGDIWKSTDGISWTQLNVTNSFGARRDFQAFIFNNKVCIIAGYKNGGGFGNDIWMSNALN